MSALTDAISDAIDLASDERTTRENAYATAVDGGDLDEIRETRSIFYLAHGTYVSLRACMRAAALMEA